MRSHLAILFTLWSPSLSLSLSLSRSLSSHKTPLSLSTKFYLHADMVAQRTWTSIYCNGSELGESGCHSPSSVYSRNLGIPSTHTHTHYLMFNYLLIEDHHPTLIHIQRIQGKVNIILYYQNVYNTHTRGRVIMVWANQHSALITLQAK